MMLAEFNWNALFRVEILAMIMGCLIPIACTIAWAWTHIEKTKSDNALKRSMIERGLSVDEIERVLSAGQHDKN